MRTCKLNSPSRLVLVLAIAAVLFALVPEAHAQGGARPVQAPQLVGGTTLVSPSGVIGTNNPTYTWNSVFDASWYYIYIQGPSGLVHADWYSGAQVCVASTCSLANVKTLAVGEHRWWIQTWNSSGYGPWSAGLTFNVPTPTPPGQATLTSPTGDIVTNNPTYTWNKVSDTTWYYLYVSGPSGYVFTNWYQAVSFCDASLCSVSNATPGLAGGDYRWWVQTWSNSGGYGLWSTGMSFALPVPKPPLAATLVSPNGSIASTQPTYTWNEVLDSAQGDAATWYFLWVQDPTGDVIEQWYSASTSCSAGLCSATPSIAVTPGSTRWWVQTWNSAGYGPWSAGMTFSIPIPWPLQPTLISPSNTTTDLIPTYTWSTVSSETGVPASWYQLSVNGPSGNLLTEWYDASLVCSGPTCLVTPATMLSPGTHTWQVRGYNAAGNGAWSTSTTFTLVSTGGFNSQFNGSAPGWLSVAGPWYFSNSWIRTTGSPSYSKSAIYATTTYADFDYSASFQRSGCNWCDNFLYVRGTPSPISAHGFWYEGYQFTYANDGYFSVWLALDGYGYLIQDYTYTPAIVPGGWNTLRVVASGDQMLFYINGTLVWTGTDYYLASGGHVGLGMDNFEDNVTAGDQLLVDWAILNSYANDYRLTITDTLSAEQQALNAAANADDTDNSFRRKPFMIKP